MITRPIRERSVAKLEEQAETLINNTGYDEISLMSLSSADHSHIQQLVKDLIGKYEHERIGVSLPSIRADSDCVRFVAEIEKVRKTGLTFAPEAGTQRLRDTINKNVTEDDLLEAVDTALACGWRKIKLYFMIGLPTETDEDIEAIGNLVWKVLDLAKARRRPLTINVGVSSFVPKPHTPFQWRGQDTTDDLRRKIGILRTILRGKSISFSWHDTDMSELEAIFARGGRELGPSILKAWQMGAKFDGWDDRFNAERWRQAFEQTGVDAYAIAHRQIGHDEPLPWDHIDIGVTKRWLTAQDTLADKTKTTQDCRFGTCLNCGINEFLKIADCGSQNTDCTNSPEGIQKTKSEIQDEPTRTWYRLIFAKDRSLRWLGHLDLVRTLERAVRRARIPVAYSEGFNPRPRMSFYTQLPVGMTGEAEPMTIELTEKVDPNELMCALNSALPNGLSIRSAEEVEGRKSPEIHGSEYLIGVTGTCSDDLEKAVSDLMSRKSAVVERKKEHTSKPVDIRPGIESIEILHRADQNICTGLIRSRLANVRPVELVAALRDTVPGIDMQFAHRIKIY
jgi:radical SAM-linked protein